MTPRAPNTKINNPSPIPSPLVPKGSFLEQKLKSRARVRLAICCALSVNILLFFSLLIIGCRKSATDETGTNSATNAVAPAMTNVVETNVPATNMTYTPPPETNVAPPVPPQPPVTGAQTYKIAAGDTFSGIAKKFSVKVKTIEDANPNVDPKKLKVGQTIQIPASAGGATGAGAMAMSNAETPVPDTGTMQTYTVKSGDTLTKIAKDFHVSVKSIEAENKLSTTKIKVGDKLKIPAKSAAPEAVPVSAPATPPTAPAFSECGNRRAGSAHSIESLVARRPATSAGWRADVGRME